MTPTELQRRLHERGERLTIAQIQVVLDVIMQAVREEQESAVPKVSAPCS